MHAVLVDDDPVSLLVVQHVLSNAGWTVVSATSATEALAVITTLETAPNVIICDYHMPGGSGLDLLEALQAQHMTVPFLLLTGVGEQAEITDDRVVNIAGFLTKPVHSSDLLTTVDALTAPTT